MWSVARHGLGLDPREAERVSPPTRMLGEYIGAGTSKYTDYDQAVTDKTVDWLSAHKDDDQPWCLYVGLVAPHFPLVVPQEFFDLYPPDSLASPKDELQKMAMCATLGLSFRMRRWRVRSKFKSDAERRRCSGRLFRSGKLDGPQRRPTDAALKSNGLTDETTVIYSSDHGDNVGHGDFGGNPISIRNPSRVPMIMAGPDVPVGTCETPVDLLDICGNNPCSFRVGVPKRRRAADLRLPLIHLTLSALFSASITPWRGTRRVYVAQRAMEAEHLYRV